MQHPRHDTAAPHGQPQGNVQDHGHAGGARRYASPSTKSHAAPSERADPEGHESGHGGQAQTIAGFWRRLWVSATLTLPILALSPLIQRMLGLEAALHFDGDVYLLWFLASFVYAYGGLPFLRGFAQEARALRPGMMTLVAVAITTAYAYSTAVVFGLPGTGFFWELATLVDIMLFGHLLEMRSVMGASRALEELVRLLPATAHRLEAGGVTRDVPLSALAPGDRVLVKPGEKLPVDGEVLAGESAVDEAMLTGESAPVDKGPGAGVIGGAINGEGALTVEVKKTGRASYLNQVVELVRRAQESKSKTQNLADRAAVVLTVVAVGGGAVTAVVWLTASQAGLAFAVERTVTVMVIACPHALGLAVPLVVAVSTALSARNGLLIRDRAAFERGRNIQAVIFDKTGTLTEGRFGVTDVLPLSPAGSPEELLALAAAIEANSAHPIAKGIVASARGVEAATDFKSIPGHGAYGRVRGRRVHVVSPGYLAALGLTPPAPALIEPLAAQGKTIVFVVVDGALAGAVALADVIRPESRAAVERLRSMGVKTLLLTGDNRRAAQWVARAIGIDEAIAEVLPHEKAAKVREVQARGLTVAMTGDGVNDAPALAQADIGIAIGAGTDVAVETADIVLVRNNPLDVAAVVDLSRATYRKMIQNLWWATGYNVVAIPLAAGAAYRAGIVLSPAAGAVLMALSTVIVAINARRLRVKR